MLTFHANIGPISNQDSMAFRLGSAAPLKRPKVVGLSHVFHRENWDGSLGFTMKHVAASDGWTWFNMILSSWSDELNQWLSNLKSSVFTMNNWIDVVEWSIKFNKCGYDFILFKHRFSIKHGDLSWSYHGKKTHIPWIINIVERWSVVISASIALGLLPSTMVMLQIIAENLSVTAHCHVCRRGSTSTSWNVSSEVFSSRSPGKRGGRLENCSMLAMKTQTCGLYES